MKRIVLTAIAVLFVLFILSGCTENEKAKQFGGTATVDLPVGHKLVNATWKESDLWYLTRPMRPDETAEIYYFKEESSWGIMQGTVIIKEHKDLTK